MIGLRGRYEKLESPNVEIGPLEAGERAEALLTLPQQIGWSCRVVDPEGKPVAQAEVFAYAVGEMEFQPRLAILGLQFKDDPLRLLPLGSTDQQGRLQTTSLGAGNYDIGVLAKGYGPEVKSGVYVGRVSAGERVEETRIVLQPALPAKGSVVDEEGKGIEGATLQLQLGASDISSSLFDAPPVARSGKGGDFEFKAVPPGWPFRLLLRREGYVDLLTPELVLADEDLRLVLVRAGKVRGKVTAHGSALARAFVQVYPESENRSGYDHIHLRARTQSDGSYEIDGLGRADYRLQVDGPPGLQGFKSEIFRASAGEIALLDVELDEAAIVHGRVLRAGGAPVEEARVQLDREGAIGSYARSDALGQYRMEDAAPGQATLRVQTRDGRTNERQVVIEDGVNEIDIELPKSPFSVQGKVVDESGEPVAGAFVYLEGRGRVRAVSGEDGMVLIDDLDPGSRLLRIEKAGYVFMAEVLQIDNASLEGLEWRLVPARTNLAGQIYGLGAAQLASVRVKVGNGGGLELPAAVARGRYTVAGLAEGKWSVTAMVPEEDLVVLQELDIEPGQTEVEADLDFGRVILEKTTRRR